MSQTRESTTTDLTRFFNRLLQIAILVGLVWLAQHLASVLIPFVIAFLGAYILHPLTSKIEAWVRYRIVAVVLTLVLLMGISGVLAAVVWPVVSRDFQVSVQAVQQLVQQNSAGHQRMLQVLPKEVSERLHDFLQEPEVISFLRAQPQLSTMLLNGVKTAVPQLWNMVSHAFTVLGLGVQAVLVFVYLIFLLMDFRWVQRQWASYLPQHYRSTVVDFINDLHQAMASYFRGQLVVACCVAVLFAIGFSLLGFNLAIVLGLMLGLMNMVPYLQLVGMLPAYGLGVLTAITQGSSVWFMTLGVTLVFVVVQLLQDLLITPKIMGKTMGLRPVLILFSLLFWGKLLGFLGVLLGIPLTCLALVYYRRLVLHQPRLPDS